MTISFETVPATRVPGFYAEFRARSAPSISSLVRPTCIVGQSLSTGTATYGVPVLVLSAAHARVLFGVGSTLSHQCAAYVANDPTAEVWAIPLEDKSSGTAASGTITFSGTTTGAGEFRFSIAGREVVVPIASGSNATAQAAAAKAAINAVTDLPVTADNTAGVLTNTCRHKGTVGNQIKTYRDTSVDLPAGASAPVIVQLASGATDPDDDGITEMGTQEFDAIALALADSTNLTNWKTAIVERWGPTVLSFGQVFACVADTVSNLASFGAARNNAYEGILGQVSPYSPAYEVASAYAGACMARLRNDPAANLNGVTVKGIRGPDYADALSYAERSVLLNAGISTYTVDRDGTMRIDRPITTYRTDSSGSPDESWLDLQTPFSVARFTRRMKARVARVQSGAKLADDGAPVGGGQNIVTPRYMRAEILSEYAAMEADGLVEDPDGFDAELVVERNGSDPQRLDIFFPPNWVNQYLVTGSVVSFER